MAGFNCTNLSLIRLRIGGTRVPAGEAFDGARGFSASGSEGDP